jgi:flagellar assembly protein FliH
MIMSELVRLSLADVRHPVSAFTPLAARPASTGTPAPAEADEPDSYAAGYAAGQQAAAAVFATEHTAMADLLATASALQPEPSEEIAAMIALTVERLVRDCVGNAPVDRDWLLARVHMAADLVSEADCARTLWIHPDDLPLIEGIALAVVPMPDPSLERGGLRIDCSVGWIEDGRSIHLEALRAELGLGLSQ